MPFATKDALAAWAKGDPIISIRLLSEGADQRALHAYAFLLAKEITDFKSDHEHFHACVAKVNESHADLSEKLTKRERQSAESFAFCILREGYAPVVQKFPASEQIQVSATE
jgi:hypothetical protein